MPDLLTIDGSYGEGGGQVIRTCVALAAMTGRPIEILNVRGGRAKPGLQPQHLMAVRAAAQICNAEIKGDAVGSIYLRFEPRMPVAAGDYRFDIGTAGSANLVVQTVLVPLALAAESSLTVTGGTHNPMAPSAEYLEHVALPAFARMGLVTQFASSRPGFFPKGGGEIKVRMSCPNGLQGIDLTSRGEIRRTRAVVLTAELPDTVADRGERSLWAYLPAGVQVEKLRKSSPGAGAAVFVGVEAEGGFGGFTGLGSRGKPMEKVAEDAGVDYQAWMETGAAVDEHLADQLVLPAAMSPWPSAWRTSIVTEHLRTMAWLVPQFRRVAIDVADDGLVTVKSG